MQENMPLPDELKKPELEKDLVIYIVDSQTALLDVGKKLTSEHFVTGYIGEAYQILKDSYLEKKKLGRATLKVELEKAKLPTSWLFEDTKINSGEELKQIVARLLSLYEKRKMYISLSEGLGELVLSDTPLSKVASNIMSDLGQLSYGSRPSETQDVYENLKEEIKLIQEGKRIKTGWDTLDIITPSYISGHLWIVGAFCMGKNTRIKMYDGTEKFIQNIKTGDRLSPVGDVYPRQVLSTTRGKDEMFEISGKYIDTFTVNKEHILPMYYIGDGYAHIQRNKLYNIPVKDYIKKSKREQRGWRIVKQKSITGKQPLLIPPYLLGLWLGDGNKGRSIITVSKKDTPILDYLKDYCISNNLNYVERDYKSDGALSIGLSGKDGGDYRKRGSKFHESLKYYGLLGNKHIPDIYLQTEFEDRLELLAGLIDSDGAVSGASNSVLVFYNTNKELIDQTVQLCESLGFNTSVKKENNPPSNFLGRGRNKGFIYRIHITGHTSSVPCKLKRKVANGDNSLNLLKFEVKSIGIGEYFGFELDGNHLYLAANNIVQHNTGTGKTWYSLQSVKHIVEQKGKVALFSTEMQSFENLGRIIGNETGRGYQSLWEHNQSKVLEGDDVKKYISKIKPYLKIYDDLRTIKEIAAEARSLIFRGELDVLVIDFIQNIDIGNVDVYQGFRAISQEIQAITKDLKVTTIITSQLSNSYARMGSTARTVEYKNAGELAASADVGIVLFDHTEIYAENMMRKEFSLPYNHKPILCDVKKSRHTSGGVVPMILQFPSGKLVEASPQYNWIDEDIRDNWYESNFAGKQYQDYNEPDKDDEFLDNLSKRENYGNDKLL